MAPGLRLWYREPARIWSNALPIGNGKFGAMVWGQVQKERWQLNEDSVWYGGPADRNPKDALQYLPELRRLLDQGQLAEAEMLVERAFVAMPQSQRHYETLGLADLIFPHKEKDTRNYQRWLDLETATTGVSYDLGEVQFKRELFSSHPANVIAAEFTASKPGMVTFDLRIIRQAGMPIHDRPSDGRKLQPQDVDTNTYMDSVAVVDNVLVMKARTGGNGVQMCLTATVTIEGGTLKVIGETITVQNADKANVTMTSETTFRHEKPEMVCLSTLAAAAKFPYSELRHQHISDYQSLFSTVHFSLGSRSAQNHSELKATSDLMKEARAGVPDVSLITLYYQYARYLLISSSRSGPKALPANLQGIWNERMAPTWGSKFTININTEMNYWIAGPAGLSECHLPLFDLIERLAVNGAVTARKMYGCGGWCAHHNTDIWADSAPQDRVIQSTLWPMGGGWLCTHILSHFDYTGDVAFLQRMYPIMKGSVEFFLDFLIDREGYKVTSPSLSPENTYRHSNGEESTMCIAPTMDSQILFRLFTDFLSVSTILSSDQTNTTTTVVDSALLAKVELFRSLLPPLKIGKHGQLQEWAVDYDEVEPGHRHVSHLWGLYPSSQITYHDSALMSACKVTLARRAATGGGHTGWSRAWMIALWARLCDGDEAGRHVKEILRTSTHDSLLDDHPPFQIDGNFGAAAGISEMLIQGYNGELTLLPCLPSWWEEGEVRGFCVRGGFEVDLRWQASALLSAAIKSQMGGKCVLNCAQTMVVKGKTAGHVLARSSKAWEPLPFETQKGEVYVIEFP